MALTTAQLQTFKADILANTDPIVVTARANGDAGTIANWYNGDSTFVVYKTSIDNQTVGDAYVANDLGNMTTGNLDRVRLWHQVKNEVRPADASDRAFFDNTFGGAAGAATRAVLAALWKRFARRIEKLFATGTGTDANPGLLVFEGFVSFNDVAQALAS